MYIQIFWSVSPLVAVIQGGVRCQIDAASALLFCIRRGFVIFLDTVAEANRQLEHNSEHHKAKVAVPNELPAQSV